MCGIAGFIDFNNKSSFEILKKCTDSLFHRGPDGSGYEFYQTNEAQIGLGHRRLSIIDLTEGGKQPKNFQDLWITFNGEIYNYKEIKAELTDLGHSFESHSDTEVILHAYEQWGKQCVNRFVGMFSFVLYDAQKKELYCVRDRAGVKPLQYYWNKGLFLFASEFKAFHEHPDFVKELNLDAIASFMRYGYVPTPHSIFKNAFKLEPGHYLSINIATQTIKTEKYWDVYDYYNKPKLKISFEDAKIETESILSKAFQYRMVADVPIGVFLSGGYDSTCVTALLQKDSTQKIKTYTIGVNNKSLDEAPYAKQIANHLGTEHTEYYCDEKEAMNIIPELPHFFDEPFGDYSAIPTTLVSRIARKEVTVALSADAGDEIFAGYNRYDYYKYVQQTAKIPSLFRSLAAKTMALIPAKAIPVLGQHPLFGSRYGKIKNILKDNSTQNLMNNLVTEFTNDGVQHLFKSKISNVDTYFDQKLMDEYDDGLSYMMAVDYQTYMLDDILQKVDRATMTTSLEGREPFLDQHIVQWAAQLPTEYKYNKGNKKYIIKEIVAKYIPREMMDRPKMGFAIPLETWLKTDLKYLTEEYLNANLIEKQGIFKVDEVQKITNSFHEGKSEFLFKIWYLLAFQMWYKKWMN
jgi:asparagine synthase (glutamine-hydrolysing)